MAEEKDELADIQYEIRRLWYLLKLQILTIAVVSLIPGLTLFVFLLVHHYSPVIPVIKFNPLGIAVRGEGVPVTILIIGAAILRLAQKLWGLNRNLIPTVEYITGGDGDGEN